jgi:hypothetical protein
MTIEVRQLLIKSTVGGGGSDPAPAEDEAPADRIEQLREELLAECKAWVEDRLQRARER